MSNGSKEQSKPSEEEEQGEENTKKVPSLWRIGGYRMWFTADTALALGSSMRDVVIALVAYSLSHSLVWSGMLATARELVILAMATVGGTVVDRHPRKKLVLIDVWCNMVVWGVVTVLMVAGWLTFPVYVAALLAAAVVNGLLGGATDAMLRSIVPTVAFAKAQAVNEGRDAAVDLAGGPLGGAIYAVQTWLPFLSSVVMYAIAGVSVLQVKIDESALKRSSDDENGASGRNGVRGFAADFVGGWRWFFSTKRLPMLTVTLMLSNFAGVGLSQGVELHLVSVGTSAFWLGMLNTFTCVAVLLGSLIAGKLSSKVKVGHGLFMAILIVLATLCAMTVWHGYWALVALMCVAVLLMPLMNALLMGFVFARTPVDMQGRADTCLSVPASLLAALSGSVAGWVLDRYGFATLTVMLCVFEAGALLIIVFSSRVRTIPAAPQWDATDL